MKRLRKLLTLLIFAVASILVFGAFHDWWANQYNAENPFGRGIRKLSAVMAENSTSEKKSAIIQLPRTTKLLKITKASTSSSTSSLITPTAKRVGLLTTKKSLQSHIKLKRLQGMGNLFKHNSSAADLSLVNMMLKARNMKIIKKDQVVRVLLVTYFRGGSTFLGDILQQKWKTFYHFEPLHYMSISSRIASGKTKEAFSLLSLLFRCNFDPLTRYTKWAMFKKHQFLFKRNLFLWSMCHIRLSSCFMPQHLREICLRAPVQVMKVTRLYLRDALRFVNENRDLNIKLIYLTRDPRGIFSSRRVLEWCQKDGCDSPKKLCKEMSADAEHLKNNSVSFKWLRYEDVCLNPVNATESLYKWLGIPYSIGVANYLRSHTNAKKVHTIDPYSTRRNTTTAPFEWLHRLSFPEVHSVQSQCKDVMRTMRYKIIDNVTYIQSEEPENVLDMIP